MKPNPPIKNLFSHISSLAQTQPNKIAILGVDREGNIQETITYKDLKDRVEATAFWLMQNGLKDLDVLALAIPSSPFF